MNLFIKKFFANSIFNNLFFVIIIVFISVYMEIVLNIRLSNWGLVALIVPLVMISDYIKKRCREYLEENKY